MREFDVHETETEYARLWHPDQDDRTLFITHLTPDSATRYRFDITDPDTGDCVYVQGDGTTPPRVVLKLLSENEYRVQNLPNIEESDPLLRSQQVGEAIEWLSTHGGFEEGDIRGFAYDRAKNVLPVIYGSALILDCIGPNRYSQLLQEVLKDATSEGREITPEELLEPRTHDIEFLQTLVVEMRRALPMDEQEQIVAMAEDRLGITPSDSGPSSKTMTWQTTTQGESSMQLNKEAVATLKEEGWFDNADFEF